MTLIKLIIALVIGLVGAYSGIELVSSNIASWWIGILTLFLVNYIFECLDDKNVG